MIRAAATLPSERPSRRRKRRRIEWARLNYILLPEGKSPGKDVRRSYPTVSAVFGIYDALTVEGRFLALVTLIVAFAALDIRQSDSYVLFCVLAALLYSSLVVSRALKLPGVTLLVEAPLRVTVGQPMVVSLQCRNSADAPYFGLRIRGPFLPWDGTWLTPRPSVRELPAKGVVRALVSLSFTRRGAHDLDSFNVARLVPLGLAVGRRVESKGIQFLAVPPVADVTHIRTPLGRRHQPGGVALASATGESKDLLGVRPYRPGDPVRDLHARSWARTGAPVVREYQEEYFTRIGVVVDTDAARLGDASAFEAALSLAAGVVAHLSRGEALIDLLVVGGEVHSLTLGRSLGFLEQALDLLAVVERGGALDADDLAQRLHPHLPRLSCVIVVALAWDAPRRALVERIRGFGVGCAALVVTENEENAAAGGATFVSADAILSGAPLSL